MKILDRLSVLSDEVSKDFREALDWIAAQQLHYVEVRMVDGVNVVNLADEGVEAVRREVVARGLRISALASPLFKCALDPSRPVATGDLFGNAQEDLPTHFAKLRRTLEIARTLDVRFIRVFSFWRERDPQAYETDVVTHLRDAAAQARRAEKVLLLENENTCNGGYAEEVARIVKGVDAPSVFRALWDPGNENYGGRSAFPEGYAHVKEILAHVHLKDVILEAGGRPRCVPIGSGQVRYLDQLRALEEDGYPGLYCLETHYIPPGGTAMEGTARTLEGLRRVLAEGDLL